jgi:S-adenosylmethionine/arginine decarboxylase-like enzyme
MDGTDICDGQVHTFPVSRSLVIDMLLCTVKTSLEKVFQMRMMVFTFSETVTAVIINGCCDERQLKS